MFYALWTTSYWMKMSQPELLVELDEKLSRVLAHWAAVDAVLPGARPLVLLEDMDRAASEALAEQLPGLRNAVRAQEQAVVLAQAGYEERKAVVHEWVRAIFHWVRKLMKGLAWASLAGRVPGRGQGFEHWWNAAFDALSLWRKLEQDPPNLPGCWPMDLGRGRTVEQFEPVVHEFKAAYRELNAEELDLKLARGALRRAQRRATALLMAYGHGVRARLGQKGALVQAIPRLWPRHAARQKAA